MVLLLRLFPLLAAGLTAGAFYEQAKYPAEYPWIALLPVIALPVASALIGWGRARAADIIEKMLPSFILLASLAFALLLVEDRIALWAIIGIGAVSSLVSLEFSFLYAYDRARYPVNGLSRINIAYVPLILWYAASTSTGLIMFLHSDRLWHVLLMAGLGAILFRTTGHPGATWKENALWSFIGAIVGVHVGLLGILLPVSLPMHGILATLLLSGALRMRRYRYEPKPSIRQAWVEGVIVLAIFAVSFGTATWM